MPKKKRDKIKILWGDSIVCSSVCGTVCLNVYLCFDNIIDNKTGKCELIDALSVDSNSKSICAFCLFW